MNTDDRGGETPCFLHALDSAEGGLPDEETIRDVMRWRKATRSRLIAERQAIPVAARQAADRWLAAALDAELGETAGRTIALTWPFKGEPDLRAWAAARREAGARIALPVVVAPGKPLIFRLWTPGEALERGVWNIPVPPASAPELRPEIVLSPVVGIDPANYRLGYGGAFYDRTLARLRASGATPHVIGLGYAPQRLPTIFPLPHDIPMDRSLIAEL